MKTIIINNKESFRKISKKKYSNKSIYMNFDNYILYWNIRRVYKILQEK